ncbi:hypothetical protein ACDA55_07735 [Rhizobium ruizarguesonis]
MIEKKFVELQNNHVVEIHIEGGQWKYLVAGGKEIGAWDASLTPPDASQGWTVRGRTPNLETGVPWVEPLGEGQGLDYDAAAALALGFMVNPTDKFGFFEGKPFSYLGDLDEGTMSAEALPQSNAKREMFLGTREGGGWKASCCTSYWDKEYRSFMMKPLEIVLGDNATWKREVAMRRGLHWLVHASFINMFDGPGQE